MSEYENNVLITAIKDDELRKRTLSLVEKILARSHMIWGFIRYPEMADHCERHTGNVFELLTRFLVYSQKHLLEGENKLNDSELFCLIIATWLHDIGGMGGGISDKEFLSPDRARKEHPFNGGRLVLDDGTLFLDLTDDEQSAIADIVVSHSSRVELKQLQPKMAGGNSVRTELLAVLLSLADASDTQESRVGGFEEVKLKLYKLELLKNKLEEEIEKVERQLSPDEEKLAELRADVEYICAQKGHHYKHLSVKNVFFTPTCIILEKKVLTLSEYEKYFTMALSDVQKEFERVKAFFMNYDIALREVRAFAETKGDVIAELHKQIEPHKKLSEEKKIRTERIGIYFFERIEEKIEDMTFPTKDDFSNGLVYLDEQRKEKIVGLLESGKNCLLYGAPDSGKSTFALALGDYLFKNKGYLVFYLSKIRGGSWEDWYAEVKSNANKKTLFIIDDCHELEEDLVHFIDHVKGVKGPKFLFVSRTTVKEMFEEKRLPFEIVEVIIKADSKVFSGIIERYCGYWHIENFEEKIVDFHEVIKNCGNNLLMLKQSLDSWDPEKEKLSDVRREKIYDRDYKDYLERDRDLFLPLAALYQFKIPIPYNFIEREGLPLNKLDELKQKGLISELVIPNQGLYYTLHSALFARLIVDSGEYHGILSMDCITSDEYTLKILERYLQYDSTLQTFQALYQHGGIRIGKKLIRNETAIEVMRNFFLTLEDINLISARLGVLKGYNIEERIKEIILQSDTLKHFAEIIYKSPFQHSIGLLHELKLFYPKKIEELFEITINETLKYLSVLNLTQIGKFINVYIREDVYQEFIEKYLVEKLEGSNLKEIREFIYDIGKNETEIRDALVKNTLEKLGEVDLVSKIEESNLKEIRFLIHNIHNAGDDPEFGIEILKKVNLIEILKKVNLIPKIEKTSLNDINMLVYNIDQVGGDLYG